MHKIRLFLILPCVVALLAGCGLRTTNAPLNVNSGAELQPYNAVYTLDTGDKVRVSVFGQPEFNTTYSVDASGAVALPLVGAVSARGLSARQLESAIAARLQQRFIKNPNVTVEVETYRPFFILGEVMSSGQYSYVNGMSAQTAVAIAGGFSPRAVHDKVEITRIIGGRQVVSVVSSSTIIRPGDTIRVLERYI